MNLLSQQNRFTEIQLLSSVVAIVAIAVSCACFTVGICQRDTFHKKSLTAISFCLLLGATASRRIVRITEGCNQKIADILQEAEDDAIYSQANALTSSSQSNFKLHSNMRSADSPYSQSDIYIGW